MAEKYREDWSAFDRTFHKYNVYVASQYIANVSISLFGKLKIISGEMYIKWIDDSLSPTESCPIPDLEEDMYRNIRTVVAVAPITTISGLVIGACLRNIVEN